MALNWNRAKFYKANATDFLDEENYRKRDAAAKWLDRAEVTRASTKAVRAKKGNRSTKRKRARSESPSQTVGTIIYTDGACEPNPGRGGWAFVVYRDDKEIYSECGGDTNSTNNVMEMTAVIKAFEWLLSNGSGMHARVLSDSQYVVKGCNDWRHGWKKRSWRRNTGELVKNVELWKRLDGLLTLTPIRLEWVKGHAGIRGNERADELSNVGRSRAIGADRRMTLVKRQLEWQT